MGHDFLKFWKPVRKYILDQYGLKTQQLDMMLFLYSENWFMRSDFEIIHKLMPWDKKSFDKALQDGWIIKVRDGEAFKHSARYSLSRKAKNVVEETYRKLLGEEELPMIDKSTKYSSMRFNLVRERINAKQQQQHPPLGSRYKRSR